MLALLSAITGFLSSFAPEVLGMVKERRAHRDELEAMRARAELGLKEAEAKQATAEEETTASLYTAAQESFRAELAASKESKIAAYAATVRPTITYAFFILYAAVKIKIFLLAAHSLPSDPLPWQFHDFLVQVWTEEDMMMFSWIVGFWFAQRATARKK